MHKKHSMLLLIASAALLVACGQKGGIVPGSSEGSVPGSSEEPAPGSSEEEVDPVVEAFLALSDDDDYKITSLIQVGEQEGSLGALLPEGVSSELSDAVAEFDEGYYLMNGLTRYDNDVYEANTLEEIGDLDDIFSCEITQTKTQIYVNEDGGIQYAEQDMGTLEYESHEAYDAERWAALQLAGYTFAGLTDIGENNNALYAYKEMSKKDGFKIESTEAETEGAQAVVLSYTETVKFNEWAVGVTAPNNVDVTVVGQFTAEFKDGLVVADEEVMAAGVAVNPFTGEALSKTTLIYMSGLVAYGTSEAQGDFDGTFIGEGGSGELVADYVLELGDNSIEVSEDQIEIDYDNGYLVKAGAICSFTPEVSAEYTISSPDKNICISTADGNLWYQTGGVIWGTYSDYTVNLEAGKTYYYAVAGAGLDSMWDDPTAVSSAVGTFTVHIEKGEDAPEPVAGQPIVLGNNEVVVNAEDIVVENDEIIKGGTAVTFTAEEAGTYSFGSPDENVCFIQDCYGMLIQMGGVCWGEWDTMECTLDAGESVTFYVVGSEFDSEFVSGAGAGTFTVSVEKLPDAE